MKKTWNGIELPGLRLELQLRAHKCLMAVIAEELKAGKSQIIDKAFEKMDAKKRRGKKLVYSCDEFDQMCYMMEQAMDFTIGHLERGTK